MAFGENLARTHS